MNTKQAFFRMAEKYGLQNNLVNLASKDGSFKRMIASCFSNAVLMAGTARHDAFAELVHAKATGKHTAWTVDSVANIEISEHEIPAIYGNFLKILEHITTK